MAELDIEIKYVNGGNTYLWFLCFGHHDSCFYHFKLKKNRSRLSPFNIVKA